MALTKAFIHPDLIEPHYSTRIFRGILNHVQNKFGWDQASRLANSCGVSLEYLQNDLNWVSEKFAEYFYQEVAKLVDGSPRFYYEASRKTFEEGMGGFLPILITQYMEPKNFFSALHSWIRKFNKVDNFTIEMGKNHVNLKFNSHRKTDFIEPILEGWLGYLEVAPTFFGHPSASTQVVAKSSRSFEIKIEWKVDAVADILRKALIISLIVFIGTLATNAVLLLFKYDELSYGLLAVSLTALISNLALTYVRQLRRMNQFLEKIVELENILSQSDAKHVELVLEKKKLDRRYREANLLSKVIKRIGINQNPKEVIKSTMSELRNTLGFDRAAYIQYNSHENKLCVLHSEGFNAHVSSIFSKFSIDLSVKTEHQYHLGNVFKRKKNVLIPVTRDYLESLSQEGRDLVTITQSSSFLICTVASERNLHGLLLVDYYDPSKSLTSDDLHIVQNLSNQLAVYLDSALALETETELRKQFERFVPKEVVESLTKNHLKEISSSEKLVSVLFVDLRGFTARSSEIESSILMSILNQYLSAFSEVIHKHGGVVDKFLGDGLFAIFNSFDDCPDHVRAAVKAAVDIENGIDIISQGVSVSLGLSEKLSDFDVAVGVHTGKVVLGTIGTKGKTEFTAIGEVVNITSRICNFAKSENQAILCSKNVADIVKSDFEIVLIGKRKLKGIAEEIELYAILEGKSGVMAA